MRFRGSWHGLAAVGIGFILSGCSSSPPEPEGPTEPVRIVAPAIPAPTAGFSDNVQVLLPRWADDDLKEEVRKAVDRRLPGTDITLSVLDDQTVQRGWDVALAPAHSGLSELSRDWAEDRVHLYTNAQRFVALGVPSPPRTWGELLTAAGNIPPGSREFVFSIGSDPQSMIHTFEAFARICGAASDSTLSSPHLVRAANLIRDLQAVGILLLESGGGLSGREAAGRIAKGETAMGLFWDSDASWVVDPSQSPTAARLVRTPPSEFHPGAPENISQVWAWMVPEDSHLPGPEELLAELEAISIPAGLHPAPPAGVPSAFHIEFRAGQDHRVTQRLMIEAWKHGQDGQALLRGLELRMNSTPGG